jgi:hypothetical protein
VLPNFFLAGAPKAGTTSLYRYLDQHPRIFCPIKEPCYFASEFRIESCSEETMRATKRGQRELRKYLDGPITRAPLRRHGE